MLSVGGKRVRSVAALMGVALVCGAAVWSRPVALEAVPADRMFALDEYSGSASCAGCHPKQSEEFADTSHARALFRADTKTAAQFSSAGTPDHDPGTPDPEPSIRFEWIEDSLWSVDRRSDDRLPVQWCFGSGEFGTTFVTLLDDAAGRTRILEHHLSWFREGSLFALTPGHTLSEDDESYERFGLIYPPSVTQQCFSCHATAMHFEAGRLDSQSIVAGIQCERCHGPKREHVARQMRSVKAVAEPKRAPVSSREQVYACGECHRRPDEVDDAIRPDNPLIARFPSVGLVQSACFLATESSGRLVCTTCHDPHRAKRPAVSYYDRKCVGCHEPGRMGHTVCPVERRSSDCVRCHMPRVRLHEHLEFTDHWIRAIR